MPKQPNRTPLERKVAAQDAMIAFALFTGSVEPLRLLEVFEMPENEKQLHLFKPE